MSNYKAYEFEIGPLLRKLGDTQDEAAAERLGISFATFRRWKYTGNVRLNYVQADRYAIRLGYHPSSVWGEQWWRSA